MAGPIVLVGMTRFMKIQNGRKQDKRWRPLARVRRLQRPHKLTRPQQRLGILHKNQFWLALVWPLKKHQVTTNPCLYEEHGYWLVAMSMSIWDIHAKGLCLCVGCNKAMWMCVISGWPISASSEWLCCHAAALLSLVPANSTALSWIHLSL